MSASGYVTIQQLRLAIYSRLRIWPTEELKKGTIEPRFFTLEQLGFGDAMVYGVLQGQLNGQLKLVDGDFGIFACPLRSLDSYYLNALWMLDVQDCVVERLSHISCEEVGRIYIRFDISSSKMLVPSTQLKVARSPAETPLTHSGEFIVERITEQFSFGFLVAQLDCLELVTSQRATVKLEGDAVRWMPVLHVGSLVFLEGLTPGSGSKTDGKMISRGFSANDGLFVRSQGRSRLSIFDVSAIMDASVAEPICVRGRVRMSQQTTVASNVQCETGEMFVSLAFELEDLFCDERIRVYADMQHRAFPLGLVPGQLIAFANVERRTSKLHRVYLSYTEFSSYELCTADQICCQNRFFVNERIPRSRICLSDLFLGDVEPGRRFEVSCSVSAIHEIFVRRLSSDVLFKVKCTITDGSAESLAHFAGECAEALLRLDCDGRKQIDAWLASTSDLVLLLRSGSRVVYPSNIITTGGDLPLAESVFRPILIVAELQTPFNATSTDSKDLYFSNRRFGLALPRRPVVAALRIADLRLSDLF